MERRSLFEDFYFDFDGLGRCRCWGWDDGDAVGPYACFEVVDGAPEHLA